MKVRVTFTLITRSYTIHMELWNMAPLKNFYFLIHNKHLEDDDKASIVCVLDLKRAYITPKSQKNYIVIK
ncbi:hypothetical protein DsansV1_C24g0184241 [Dioscorea sansibarensis]